MSAIRWQGRNAWISNKNGPELDPISYRAPPIPPTHPSSNQTSVFHLGVHLGQSTTSSSSNIVCLSTLGQCCIDFGSISGHFKPISGSGSVSGGRFPHHFGPIGGSGSDHFGPMGGSGSVSGQLLGSKTRSIPSIPPGWTPWTPKSVLGGLPNTLEKRSQTIPTPSRKHATSSRKH